MKIVIWLLKFRLALASLEVLWLFLLETTAFISLAFNRASSPAPANILRPGMPDMP